MPIQLRPDPKRVISRQFIPGEENRVRDIIARILAIPANEIARLLENIENSFTPAHPEINEVLSKHFDAVRRHIPTGTLIDDKLRRFIGACFTMEYAIESAALFNPSMVPALDQSGLAADTIRFVMSLRATGEGHVSSIVFRRGTIDSHGEVTIEPPGRYTRMLEAVLPDEFKKDRFIRNLQTLDAWTDSAKASMALLGDTFTRAELSNAIDRIRADSTTSGRAEESIDAILSLTRANYRLQPPDETDISELVIFPFSDNERHGLEDMRLARFSDDDGSACYYGTYTAYNGYRIFPQLLSYRQGGAIDVHMLSGDCAKNKGMALFPRKIAGKYAMVARLDNESMYFMTSDDVLFWDTAIRQNVFPQASVALQRTGS
jgi:hypothetical protein